MPTNLHLIGGASDPRRQIVFIHGLGGHWQTTWRSAAGEDWLKAWLIADLPNCLIWSLEYEAPFSRWRRDCMSLPARGESIAHALLADARFHSGRLTFVCHSLGGLVFKQVLRYLDSVRATNELAPSYLERIDKVIYLGTPHSGAALATLSGKFGWITRPSSATGALRFDDPHLEELNRWYKNYAPDRIEHLVLRETVPQRLLLWFKSQVVSGASSDPGIRGADPVPIDCDHAGLTQPASKSDQIYLQITTFILHQKVEIASGIRIDQMADKINVFLHQISNNEHQSLNSSVELQVAAIATQGDETPDQGAVNDAAINEGNSGVQRVRDIQQLREYIDPQLADNRLLSIAIQALAIAEAGIRRQNEAMVRRGVEQARASLGALSPSDTSRLFLQEKMVACSTWLDRPSEPR